jgi:hypothetical protein
MMDDSFKDMFMLIITMLESELNRKDFEVSRPEVITEDYMAFLWSCLRAIGNQ